MEAGVGYGFSFNLMAVVKLNLSFLRDEETAQIIQVMNVTVVGTVAH